MALKTPDAPAKPAAEAEDVMLLELALYSRYTRKRNTYIGGQVYKFKKADALQLLSETDTGRPIWKMYKKPVAKKQTATTTVMDATNVSIERVGEPTNGLVPVTDTKKRIDVGNDDEIADILNPVGGTSAEDVTV